MIFPRKELESMIKVLCPCGRNPCIVHSFASSCIQTKNLIALWKMSLYSQPEVYKVNQLICEGKRLAFSSLKHIDYSCPMMEVARNKLLFRQKITYQFESCIQTTSCFGVCKETQPKNAHIQCDSYLPVFEFEFRN